MRTITGFGDPSLEVLSVLQHRATNEPLFPNIETFESWHSTEELTQFIHLFLSPRTTVISIFFADPSDLLKVMVASTLATFPTLCPGLQDVRLYSLSRDPMTIAAVSGMLLAANQNTLRSIMVDSPLTEEAHEVIFKLPNLRVLSVVVEENTSLPTLVLPNLIKLIIKYNHGSDWSKGFRGATLGKLGTIEFHSESEQTADFLEEFERVALATSIQNTLSSFVIYTSSLWNPNYSSLLQFTQLTYLHVGSSCDDDCFSTVDDDVITALAQAMPKLEFLLLGDAPCSEISIGVTVRGLAVLAHHCPDLSVLRVHFQVASLCAPPAIDGATPINKPGTLQRCCALGELEVGEIPVAEESVPTIALTLACIFPRIESIDCVDENWDKVMDAISLSRKIINYSSKNPAPSILRINRDTPLPGATLMGDS